MPEPRRWHTTEGHTEAIRLEGATRRFGDLLAVDDVTLSVEPGEIFAFLGPNGAGKSTTIKMMTTLLRPTSGRIELNGFDVMQQQTSARRQFGIVFQDVTVDTDLTAYENMELHAVLYGLPRSTMRARIGEYLDLVELGDRRDDFVKTFSGGMIRRLEIARGLLHAPAILFLDEPTIGLDAQTRTLLWDYVRRLNEERRTTIFFTTHYIEEAEEVAGRIGIIDHGRIVTVGTAEELERQTGSSTLEEAYLCLTGRTVREERVEGAEQLRERIRGQRR
jgi:ABC-2 type transport system ATP-binding protein